MENPNLLAKKPTLFWNFDTEEMADEADSYFQWNDEPLLVDEVTADSITITISGDALLPRGTARLRRDRAGAFVGKAKYGSANAFDEYWFARGTTAMGIVLVGRWKGQGAEGNAIVVLPESAAARRKSLGTKKR